MLAHPCRAGRFINAQRGATSSRDGWGFLPGPPQIPPHRFTRRLLGCCFAAPQLNLVGNRGSGGRWGAGCIYSRRRSPALGSRPEREQRDLCTPAAPEPALQAGTTVPLVTAEHGPLGDGSVPCHGPRDARGQPVLGTPLCLWRRVEDAGGALGWAQRVFWQVVTRGWGMLSSRSSRQRESPPVFLFESGNLPAPVPQAQSGAQDGACCCWVSK